MKNIIYITICLVVLGCGSRHSTVKLAYPAVTASQRFDIAKFNRSKSAGTEIDTLSDGSIYKAYKLTDKYYEEISRKNSPITTGYLYYANLNLKAADNAFYNVHFGMAYLFNEDGKLVDKTDQDQGWLFSIEDVINKLRNKYNIDLMVPKNGLNVSRYINAETRLPVYTILYPLERNNLIYILINGNNGDIIMYKKRIGWIGELKSSVL